MLVNVFDTYCSAVCSMVRWKHYHAPITYELTAHMEDHADRLIAKGMEPDEARRAAVAAMGDPCNLGKELDALHSPWYPRLSRVFLLLAALCLAVGLIINHRPNGAAFRFAPWASPAALVLQPMEYDSAATLLAKGAATGGGRLGSYIFSSTGSAALYRRDTDYHGDPEISYYLDVVFTSASPWLWLGAPNDDLRLRWVRQGDGPLEEKAFTVYSLPEQGVFRRYLRLRVEEVDPAERDFIVEVGDLSYTVLLREVAAP